MLFDTEDIPKIVGALLRHDTLALSYATFKLFPRITEIVALQRGVLVKTDHTYFRQVQEAVGLDSAWTHHHGLIAGSDGARAEGTAEIRAIALLSLYRETVHLLRAIMLPEHRRVVEETVLVIERAGF